jgi:YVTN family beta-propeller protein
MKKVASAQVDPLKEKSTIFTEMSSMSECNNIGFVRVRGRRLISACFVLVIGMVSIIASAARSQGAPTNTVIANIAVGGGPNGVVVSPDSNTVYVTSYFNNTVSVIDAQTNTITKSISVGKTPFYLAISSDGSKLYVSQFTSPGAVTVIDLANGDSIQTIGGISPDPLGIDLSPDGTQLWVAAGNIFRVNTANRQVLGSVTVPGGCSSLAFTPDGSKVYASGDKGTVTVISTATGSVITTIPVNRSEEAAGFAMSGQRAYALVNQGYNILTGLLLVINTATDNVIKKIHFRAEAGDRPALLPNTPYLYVPENTPSAVILFNTKTNSRIGDGVTCASGAYDVAIAPNGARAYVTDEFANNVTVIQIQ